VLSHTCNATLWAAATAAAAAAVAHLPGQPSPVHCAVGCKVVYALVRDELALLFCREAVVDAAALSVSAGLQPAATQCSGEAPHATGTCVAPNG
jgi:hypothetical protein